MSDEVEIADEFDPGTGVGRGTGVAAAHAANLSARLAAVDWRGTSAPFDPLGRLQALSVLGRREVVQRIAVARIAGVTITDVPPELEPEIEAEIRRQQGTG